jgi:hypothetical protein
MSLEEAKVRIPATVSVKRKDCETPVMFFGTNEVAWMHEKDITKWAIGIGNNFHGKSIRTKRLMDALNQVRAMRLAPPPPPAAACDGACGAGRDLCRIAVQCAAAPRGTCCSLSHLGPAASCAADLQLPPP